ncbi:MAG: hypothetical protein WAK42_05565, partial [Mycobacterium sp.]
HAHCFSSDSRDSRDCAQLYGVSARQLRMFAAKCGARGANNPAGRIGTPDDVGSAVLFAMTNTFMTGMTLRVDGGEPLT